MPEQISSLTSHVIEMNIIPLRKNEKNKQTTMYYNLDYFVSSANRHHHIVVIQSDLPTFNRQSGNISITT